MHGLWFNRMLFSHTWNSLPRYDFKMNDVFRGLPPPLPLHVLIYMVCFTVPTVTVSTSWRILISGISVFNNALELLCGQFGVFHPWDVKTTHGLTVSILENNRHISAQSSSKYYHEILRKIFFFKFHRLQTTGTMTQIRFCRCQGLALRT